MASTTTHHILPLPVFTGQVRLLAVLSPYYKEVADGLLAGARTMVDAVGGALDVIEVPGALEIPTAIALASRRTRYDGFVALGCVVRGETTHYDTVCNDSSRGLTLLGLQDVCIGNGILTVENMAQAEVRADPLGQNKGGHAAAAALHLIALRRRWDDLGHPAEKPRDLFRLASELEGRNPA
jgi:6,7-dimethyl-8-ribityllumazine synthase